MGRDALIRHWPIVGWLITDAGQSADYRPIYLSYLFRLRLLSGDSYLLEGRQSADKTKMHPQAKLLNAPTFNGNGSHCHVCLLLVIKIKTCTYQLCKQQSANTNVLIPIIAKTANDRRILIIGTSLNMRVECVCPVGLAVVHSISLSSLFPSETPTGPCSAMFAGCTQARVCTAVVFL